jgi:hypothetical protein
MQVEDPLEHLGMCSSSDNMEERESVKYKGRVDSDYVDTYLLGHKRYLLFLEFEAFDRL